MKKPIFSIPGLATLLLLCLQAPLEAAPPAKPRFGPDTLELFTTASSRYLLSGQLVPPATGIPEKADRLNKSDDRLVSEAAGLVEAISKNLRNQAAVELKIHPPSPDAPKPEAAAPPPGDEPASLADLARDEPAVSAQALLNESTELIIEGHKLSRQLRAKVAEIGRRDPATAPAATAPQFKLTFIPPGSLQIVMTSTGSLNHCVMTTSTQMMPNSSAVDRRKVGRNVVTADHSEAQRQIDVERAETLNLMAVTEERGFTTYVEKLRGGEVLIIPFCDMRSMDGVKEVRLSLWCDEMQMEDAVVGGLTELRQARYREEQLWKQGLAAEGAALRPLRWPDPLGTNEPLAIPSTATSTLSEPPGPVGQGR